MSQVKKILGAMRTRCEATTFNLVQGRPLDAKSDPVPSISYFFHPKKGVESDDEDPTPRGLRKETLYLVIEAHQEVTSIDDSFEELEDVYDQVRAKVLDSNDPFLGDLARDHLTQTTRNSYPPDGGNIGKIQLTIAIPFVEDY